LTLAGPLAAAPLVYRFTLHDDMIDPATAFYFARAYARAEGDEADAIIIDMDTPGGELEATMQIRNRIFESDIPTHVFISHWAISAGALISLATDGIYMGPSSSIGGAQPITATGAEVPESVDEKITSIMRSEVRATIREQARKHPDRWTEEEIDYRILLAEAFITPPDEDIMSIHASGEVACSAGELLTLDWEEAIREGLAVGRCETFEDVLREIGMEGAEVRDVILTWSEQLALFFSRRAVSALLLMIGLAAIYVEFKTPGIGLALAVAVVAFTLFFFGASLADLSSVFEPVMVLIGVALLAVEIFILPGFGLAGLMGILCIVVGLVMALVKLPPPEFEFGPIYLYGPMWVVAWSMVLSIVAIAALAHWLPRTRLWHFLELEPATIGPVTPDIPVGAPVKRTEELVGRRGVALTDLRPAGKVEIEGHPFQVVTEGGYIDGGSPVRVSEVHGSQVVVIPDAEARG
jgi:membrane-bound serine protease (ClpP class)